MATIQDLNNATAFASPVADASFAAFADNPFVDNIIQTLGGLSAWQIALTLFLGLVVYDQVSYISKKGSIVGPAFKIPFMGPFLESVNPKFEQYAAKWASGELSCVSVFHKFVVIASTRDMSRKIFNSPHSSAPTTWVFLDGKAHVDFRKGLNGLFTRSALDIYLPGQEDVYNEYFKKMVHVTADAGGERVPFMANFREVTCAVALRTFCGTYITDEGVKKIADDYFHIAGALERVNFPIIIPFTRTWYGKRAADLVLVEFSRCAAKSKARLAAGAPANCIMDQWVKTILESAAYTDRLNSGASMEGITKPAPLLRMFSDYEIAQTVFTFLFASQDATSSAVTYLFQTKAQRPDVVDRVRAENLQVRGGDRDQRDVDASTK
ncbi:hypothetical protein VE04_07032 [Pseudogymnoascus sp. 24MN13]|nr:hypothetical protein VE04_07032 [Pseudogymnoascus sp. 24MN13]